MDRELRLGTVAVPGAPRARAGGPLAHWRRRRARRAARQGADAALLATVLPVPSAAWRAEELTCAKNRLALARSIEKLIRSADARYLPGATPLNRLAVRQEAATLQQLAARLSDLDRAVTAHGVLLLDQLLTDGYGPLYVAYRASELRWLLSHVAERLEPVA